MPYDPAAHQRLEGLARKYRDWLSHARSAQESGRPVINADGVDSSLSDCYQDAWITAHAVYVYLVENPPANGLPRGGADLRPPRPIDVLNG